MIYFPSLLAIGPSTIQPHRGFYALCCPSGLPSISQHHDVASHPFYPFYPAFATASLSLGTVGFQTPLPLQPQRKKKPHQIFPRAPTSLVKNHYSLPHPLTS